MLIFSKLDDDALMHISTYLDTREFVAFSESFTQNKKNKIYTKLLDFSKINDNILLAGDLLIHVYSDLSPDKKVELYQFVSSLCNKFDFHLRHHALILLNLLFQKKYLSSVQCADFYDKLLQLCGDRNLDIKFQALELMLNFFPQLNVARKNALFTLIVSNCENLLDTDMSAFAKRFLIQNDDYLSDLQKTQLLGQEPRTSLAKKYVKSFSAQ